MRPFYLFLLAILTPLALSVTLFVPSYGGFLGACYYLYSGTDPHPLADRLYDVFYIFDVYGQLFTYMKANLSTIDVVHYILPVIGLPVMGVFTSFWLTRKLSRGLRELFLMAASAG